MVSDQCLCVDPWEGSAFPMSAMTRGPPESPVLAFWGGMTRDYGDVGDLLPSPSPAASQIGVGFREVIPSHPRLA